MSDEEHQQGVEHTMEENTEPQQDTTHADEAETSPAGEQSPEEEGAATGHAGDQEEDEGAAPEEGEQPAGETGELAAQEESYMDGNPADKQVFLAETRRIDESTTTIIRALSAMTNIDDVDVRANIGGVLADIQAEEANLFGPIPDYIAQVLEKENAARAKRTRGVQAHDEVLAGAGGETKGVYSEERRAFVDPSKPLALPYSLTREQKENPNRNAAQGVYHDIFYGDGSQCVFSPPEDNKRVQLERERAAKELPRRPPVSYEPAPRPVMKVGPDFVPSCAEGTSPSQRESADPAYRRSSGFNLRSSRPAPRASSKSTSRK